MTSGYRREPYFRRYDRELVLKPAISLKKSLGAVVHFELELELELVPSLELLFCSTASVRLCGFTSTSHGVYPVYLCERNVCGGSGFYAKRCGGGTEVSVKITCDKKENRIFWKGLLRPQRA